MKRATYKLFGLTADPFSKEIDDGDLWMPPSKKEVVEAIVQTLRDRQHVLVVGEPGAGKTAVLRAVRNTLPRTRFRLTYCHNATLGRRDFYRQICQAIGLTPKATAAAVFNALSEYVQDIVTEQQQHPVFLLDEAHLMKDEMLDHLHILQNYNWDSKSMLSLVLVGLPELRERLMRRRHRSLMGRVHLRATVDPLLPSDTADYLRHRLAAAGVTQQIFPNDTVALLHEKTAGLMRDLDRIASVSLDLAAASKDKTVHKDVVLRAFTIDAAGALP